MSLSATAGPYGRMFLLIIFGRLGRDLSDYWHQSILNHISIVSCYRCVILH